MLTLQRATSLPITFVLFHTTNSSKLFIT